jgi:hypothetical protein
MAADRSAPRAVLIGTGSFRDPGLDELPVARNCVTAMADLLTGELCGWPPERVTTLLDVDSPSDLARALVAAAREAEGVLLVYYVGHGLATRHRSLALALSGTSKDPEELPHTSMVFDNLADILAGSTATTKLVILDCCHAELAARSGDLYQGDELPVAIPVDGMYCVYASRKHEAARTPADGPFTYFTQTLLDVLDAGIPGLPATLTMEQIFVQVRARLVGSRLPEPVDSGARNARHYPFARNAATASAVEPVLSAAEAATPVPTAVTTVTAETAVPPPRRPTPAPARAVASAGDRAARLRVPAVSPGERRKALVLHGWRVGLSAGLAVCTGIPLLVGDLTGWTILQWIGWACLALGASMLCTSLGAAARLVWRLRRAPSPVPAASAPVVKAQRLAESIQDLEQRARALGDVARFLAPTNPGVAAALAQRSLDTALSVSEVSTRDAILAGLAPVLARVDPVGAERSTELIADRRMAATALAGIAAVLADGHRAQATRLARRSRRRLGLDPHVDKSSGPLISLLARSAPAGAAGLARKIINKADRAAALASVAEVLGRHDPVRADRLTDEAMACADRALSRERSEARMRIARAVAGTSPRRAELIARQEFASKADVLAAASVALQATDPEFARNLADQAEQQAEHERTRRGALEATARAFLPGRADRAERIARLLDPGRTQARLLVEIAAGLRDGDPVRARQLADEAEAAMREDERGLADLVGPLAAVDPARAERIVEALSSTWTLSQAQADLVSALTAGSD